MAPMVQCRMSAGRTYHGGVARASRTRRAIGDAFLELVEEGRALPTVDDVAQRAGVGRRTVFHHFHSLDRLVAAAVETRVNECSEFVPEPAGTSALDERIATTVERLDACYARLAPIQRTVVAAALDTPSSPAAHHLARLDAAILRHVSGTYRAELSARPDPNDALVDLESALSFELWRHLRITRGLGRGATRRQMARLARAVLGVGDETAGLALWSPKGAKESPCRRPHQPSHPPRGVSAS